MNTYDEWQVDLPNRSATHSSGLRITVEGSPANPSAVYPGPFPNDLSALKQVQLLREGMLAIASAFKTERSDAQAAAQNGSAGDYSKYYRKPQAINDGAEPQEGRHKRPVSSQGDRKSSGRHVTSGFLRSGRQAQHRAQQRAQHQGNHAGGAHTTKHNRFQKKDSDFNGDNRYATGNGYSKSNGYSKTNNYSQNNSYAKNSGHASSNNGASHQRSASKPHDRFSQDAHQRRPSSHPYSSGHGQNRYADKPYANHGNGYKKPNTPYFPSDSNNPSSYGNGYNRRVLAADQLKSQNRRGNESISDDHFKERSVQRSTSGNAAIKTVNKVAIKRAPSKMAASDKDKKPLLSLKDKS